MRNPVLLFSACFLMSCASGKLILNTPGNPIQSPPSEEPSYSIYALGDAGEINSQSKAVLQELKLITSDDHQPGMVVFLGDNVYPAGVQPEENPIENKQGKEILLNQIDGLKNYKGKIIFVPGNHDWNEYKPGGLKAIRREGDFLDHIESSHVELLPQNGCSGPDVVELNDHLVMIFIDSQWWIQDWVKEPGMNKGCEHQSREEFVQDFHKKIAQYKDRQIIVAMHHPFYTQGSHGGHFTLKSHLFPLTALVKWLYVPLPVIGSIYPFYRTIFGHSQDLKKYKTLREALLKDLDPYTGLIFLAGHEHCLQYIRKNGNYYLVSGAGSKQTAIARDPDLVYGHKSGGIMELDFYKNGNAWLSVFEVNPKKQTSGKVFSQQIIEKSAN